MKGIYTETSFGKKLRSLEGYRQTIHKRSTNGGSVYDIKPMRDVDLAHFFGMKTTSGGSDTPLVDSSGTNPPPTEPSTRETSKGPVDSVDGLPLPFLERSKKWNQNVYKRSGVSNPPHPPLVTVTERVKAAMADGCNDEDAILKWCSDRGLALARSECRRTMKRLCDRSEAA